MIIIKFICYNSWPAPAHSLMSGFVDVISPSPQRESHCTAHTDVMYLGEFLRLPLINFASVCGHKMNFSPLQSWKTSINHLFVFCCTWFDLINRIHKQIISTLMHSIKIKRVSGWVDGCIPNRRPYLHSCLVLGLCSIHTDVTSRTRFNLSLLRTFHIYVFWGHHNCDNVLLSPARLCWRRGGRGNSAIYEQHLWVEIGFAISNFLC